MVPVPQPSEYTLTTGDLADRFGVNIDTVARWADGDKLPCLKTPGGFRRFRPEDVDEFALTLLPSGEAS